MSLTHNFKDPEQGLKEKLIRIRTIRKELQERTSVRDPTTYGLPDLLGMEKEDKEKDDEFECRQNQALKEFVEGNMYVVKDGKRIAIHLVKEMVDFIADMFYWREQKGICWKGRGSGGSLTTAIFVWLKLVYWNQSFLIMAGSRDQASQIYEYTKNFWDCFPEMSSKIVVGDPLVSRTRLRGNAELRCVTTSEKSARSKHMSGLVIDEACMNDSRAEAAIRGALQIPLSEPRHTIVLVSTFHLPTGFFADVWDNNKPLGYKKYKWDCYDISKPCSMGLDKAATKKDPKAITTYCRKSCPLTRKREKFNDLGIRVGEYFIGCNGKARDTKGFRPIKELIRAFDTNKGTRVFNVEYECTRPQFESHVYDVDKVKKSVVQEFMYEKDYKKVVGIDWGYQSKEGLAMVLLARLFDSVVIMEESYFTNRTVDAVLDQIKRWERQYGNLTGIMSDSSHPFNNADLTNSGYEVHPVPFNKWKEPGITNIEKYFGNGRLLIHEECTTILKQLETYRRDVNGKPVKHNDHGCDALLCGMLAFPYVDEFPIGITEESEDQILKLKGMNMGKKKAVELDLNVIEVIDSDD